ncbi:MAG: hypothetical protein K0R29_1249 [Pseudobdellovibrio sp.]|jgi:ectoine hydroxylase-related dioxygenase (phytanoyl-CoA dioxygenase family)|nr:hypothetical protein [Pseudobdellovibrio sp.]
MGGYQKLSPQEIDKFESAGFLKFPGAIFGPAEFAELKTYAEDIVKEQYPTGKSGAVPKLHYKYPYMLKWILAPEILDRVQDLIGPNIGLWTSSIFFKAARTEEKAYWHKDIYGIYRYNLFENKNLLNFTVALYNCNAENGCLKYLAGTHKTHIEHDLDAPPSDLITLGNAISDESVKQYSPVHMELKPNEASVHNVNVVHGSDPNLSPYDRLTLSARFFSTDNKCFLENFQTSGIGPVPHIVRGDDTAHSNLKRITLPPELLRRSI